LGTPMMKAGYFMKRTVRGGDSIKGETLAL
jgi:hypothetical protein